MNPYEILGLDVDATQEQIRDAYIRLSKEKHPDVEGGSHDEFVKIKSAYDVLNDPAQRQMFDHLGVMPGTEEYQILNEAVQSISRAFDQFMNAIKVENLAEMNPVQSIRETIRGSRREGEKNLAEVCNALDRCQRAKKIMAKQLKQKNKKKPDIFAKFLDEKIIQINMTITAMERALSVYRNAEEILEDYEFTVEKEKDDAKSIGFSPLFISGFGGMGGGKGL